MAEITVTYANPEAERPRSGHERQTTVCQVCMLSGEHRKFEAREMMFGSRDRFQYFECSDCGCLQIDEVPDDLGKYYPTDYYSFTDTDPAPRRKPGRRERFVIRRISTFRLRGRGPLGAFLTKRHASAPDLPLWLKRKELHLRLGSRILDVGCGRGELLLQLRELGFTKLLGADPFIESDINYDDGLKILKATLPELKGKFDLVMLHHSFEHMARPRTIIKELYRLTRQGRHVILRLPLAGSYAWRKYGTDWVNLDAPRHLFLHTPRSVGVLAEHAGFRVAGVVYDSKGFTFAGSEQYRAGIPLIDPRSFVVNPPGVLFSEERWREFEARAAELNDACDGDQACFYLYKP